MASTSKSSTLFFPVLFALALTLLLATCIAARDFYRLEVTEAETPGKLPTKCGSVHAVQSGETCFTIAKQFNLSTAELLAINLNIVCDKLLVGQWLCILAGAGK